MPGTTNLLQWNPTGANQETDAAYLADSQRAGGATDPSLFASVLANKAFYQWSTYLYAFFTAFANKGFSTSDANVSTLTAQCANFLTSADIKPGLQYVLYAPTLTFNCTQANGFQVPLNGNLSFTLSTPSIGQQILLAFTQDGVGGHTVTWPSSVVGYGTVDTTANKTSQQLFIVLNDNLLHPISPMTVS
jgi:hypothetical protein